jgi:hypothetical protein
MSIISLLKQHLTFESAVIFFRNCFFASIGAIYFALCLPLNLGTPLTIALVLSTAKFQIIGCFFFLTGFLLLILAKWATPLIRTQWKKYFAKKK